MNKEKLNYFLTRRNRSKGESSYKVKYNEAAA